MATTPDPAPASSIKWWVCVLLLLASTLNYMDRQALSQTSKRITDDLGITKAHLGDLEGAFNAAFAAGALLFGWAVDRGNVRLIYPFIVVGWSLAGFAAGFADSFRVLLVCRFALGLFEAANVPCGVVTVKRVLPPEERALGNGLFQSGSALGAVITPLVVLLCLEMVAAEPENKRFAWQLPFRVVGAAGLIWAVAWLLVVKTHHVRVAPAAPDAADTYWAIFANRRFWVSLVVVMAINSAWRSFGFWLPIYLQDGKAYGERATAFLTSGFFLSADVGSMAVGAVVLRLFRGGMTLPRARLLCYAGCTGLTALSVVAAVLPKGFGLVLVLMLVGFGALGLFPIYYALSQEISQRHQGKVTGTLSCLNAAYLAFLFPLQGRAIDYFGSFELALGVAGLFPVVGLLALWLGWERRYPPAAPATAESPP
ncbi:MAG TPA: MFS transporter [Gemmataceae bacterium]|jgi:ACS family hexuronate transporter-like MFS transporter|nr:MFS transporter [Gemmataceae bacterium]